MSFIAPCLKNYTQHMQVVRVLAQTRGGLSYAEISENTGISSGGGLSAVLSELMMSEFILAQYVVNDGAKIKKYRLLDEYTLFYLTWCEPAKNELIQEEDLSYWQKMHDSPAWYAWSGYSFEGICLKHLGNIKAALGIAAVQTQSAKWIHREDGQGKCGVEIDLVIDRKDQCVNLCEIKYYRDEFVIDKRYAEILRHKKTLLY